MLEALRVADIGKYLDEASFDLDKWNKDEISADPILAKFIKFTLVLALSNPNVRKERRISKLSLPVTSSPISLIEDLIEQIKEAEICKNHFSTPEQDLITGSHLFIPYIFPYVLRILSSVEMLSDSGVKNLALQALNNTDARDGLDKSAVARIEKFAPNGIYPNQTDANGFLISLVDIFRESLGKTQTTFGFSYKYLSRNQNYFTTQDPKQQQAVMDGLITYLRPKKIVSLDSAQELFSGGFIYDETPQKYVQRMTIKAGHKEIIYRGLTS